jgi:hypothetical protein
MAPHAYLRTGDDAAPPGDALVRVRLARRWSPCDASDLVLAGVVAAVTAGLRSAPAAERSGGLEKPAERPPAEPSPPSLCLPVPVAEEEDEEAAPRLGGEPTRVEEEEEAAEAAAAGVGGVAESDPGEWERSPPAADAEAAPALAMLTRPKPSVRAEADADALSAASAAASISLTLSGRESLIAPRWMKPCLALYSSPAAHMGRCSDSRYCCCGPITEPGRQIRIQPMTSAAVRR